MLSCIVKHCCLYVRRNSSISCIKHVKLWLCFWKDIFIGVLWYYNNELPGGSNILWKLRQFFAKLPGFSPTTAGPSQTFSLMLCSLSWVPWGGKKLQHTILCITTFIKLSLNRHWFACLPVLLLKSKFSKTQLYFLFGVLGGVLKTQVHHWINETSSNKKIRFLNLK